MHHPPQQVKITWKGETLPPAISFDQSQRPSIDDTSSNISVNLTDKRQHLRFMDSEPNSQGARMARDQEKALVRMPWRGRASIQPPSTTSTSRSRPLTRVHFALLDRPTRL
jgi:hypothetical protein